MKKVFLSVLCVVGSGLLGRLVLAILDIVFPNVVNQVAIFVVAHFFETMVLVGLVVLIILTLIILGLLLVKLIKPNTFSNDK